MIQLAEVFILETLRNRDTGAEFSPERNAPMKNTCSPLILLPNSPPPSLLSLLFSFSFCIWRQWRIIIRLTYLSLSLSENLSFRVSSSNGIASEMRNLRGGRKEKTSSRRGDSGAKTKVGATRIGWPNCCWTMAGVGAIKTDWRRI